MYLYSVSRAMVTALGDSLTQKRDYEARVFYLFIYLFHFRVNNNPVLEAKQSLLEALRHIKFILSTAVRGDSLPASEY